MSVEFHLLECFDLEKYKTGKYDVVTRSGRPVRIICTDVVAQDEFTVAGLVKEGDGFEVIRLFNIEGRYLPYNTNYFIKPIGVYRPESEYDLFLSAKQTLTPAEVKMCRIMYGEVTALSAEQIDLVKHNTKVMRTAFKEPRILTKEQ
ncbi:MAG: hypothetical protein J6T22_09375 [Bacteroidales bacterium]|nr:hypothetical protein [Bacteroidales bacterium]MBO7617404.1 hypothetical protein [Bacteroidales bacterium]